MTYKRVLLKLSGEALMGDKPYGIDPAIVQSIAEDVERVIANGVQIAIVVGGGNIFRGLKGSADGMDLSLIHISEPTRQAEPFSPLNILPPPTTIASWTLFAITFSTSSAIDWTIAGSIPYGLSPISASPLSFKSTLL